MEDDSLEKQLIDRSDNREQFTTLLSESVSTQDLLNIVEKHVCGRGLALRKKKHGLPQKSQKLRKSASQAPLHEENVLAFVKLVIEASPTEKHEGTNRRLAVLCKLMDMLYFNTIEKRDTKQAVLNLVLDEIDYLPEARVTKIVEHIIDRIEGSSQAANVSEDKILEILPKAFSLIANADNVSAEINGIEREMSGADYKNHVIHRICKPQWDSRRALQYASVFKDISLTEDQLKMVINKILANIKEVDQQEVPPLIYQLLLLSTKGLKRAVIKGIRKHFSQADDKIMSMPNGPNKEIQANQLRNTEGTVLSYLDFAIKQDQELGNEYIKLLKSCKPSFICCFDIAFLFCLAKITRFKDTVFDFLKSAVMSSHKDFVKHTKYALLIGGLERAASLDDSESLHIRSIDRTILETVRRSRHGWDYLGPSIVQLGFTLMNASASGRPVSTTTTTTHSASALATALASAKIIKKDVEVLIADENDQCLNATTLGEVVLIETFNNHLDTRKEIIEQIFNNIVTKAPNVYRFISVLEGIVKQNASAIGRQEEFLAKFREAIEYLSYLTPDIASGVLRAVQPLSRVNIKFQDYIILVLRKALYSREQESRLVALDGFLQLLSNSSSSTAGSSSTSGIQQNLDLEILGFLRRAMTQQMVIRQRLYEAIIELFETKPHLRESIFDLLLIQFLNYYQEDGTGVPLKLSDCITHVTISERKELQVLEPIPHLLFCIQRCIITYERDSTSDDLADAEDVEASDEQSSYTRLKQYIDALSQRLMNGELDDFDLDKTAEYSDDHPDGRRNQLFASLLLSIYQVLMEYNMMSTASPESSSLSVVRRFYFLYNELKSTVTGKLKAKSTGKEGKTKKDKGEKTTTKGKGKKSATKTSFNEAAFTPLLSIPFTVRFLEALNAKMRKHEDGEEIEEDDDMDKDKIGPNIHADSDFQMYMLQLCTRQLLQQSNLKDKKVDLGSAYGDSELGQAGFDVCSELARLLFVQMQFQQKLITDGQSSTSQAKAKIASKTPLLLAAQCFEKCFWIACGRNTVENIATFLNNAMKDKLLSDNNDEYNVEDENIAAKVPTQSYQIHLRIKDLEAMLGLLMERSLYKEAEIIANIINALVPLVNYVPNDNGDYLMKARKELFHEHHDWLERKCLSTEVESEEAATVIPVKALISLYTRICVCAGHLEKLTSLAQEMNQAQQSGQIEILHEIVTMSTATTITSVLISNVESMLDAMNWLFENIKSIDAEIGVGDADFDEDDVQGVEKRRYLSQLRSKMEQFMYPILHSALQTLIQIERSESKSEVSDAAFTVLIRMFKFLVLLTKHIIKLKPNRPPEGLKKTAEIVSGSLTTPIYDHIKTATNEDKSDRDDGDDKKAGKNKKSKVIKESRLVPNLIFQIEQFEICLIKLSKQIDKQSKTKCDLVTNMKRSVARDFRLINKNRLEEFSDDDDEDGDANNNNNNNNSADERLVAAASTISANNNKTKAKKASTEVDEPMTAASKKRKQQQQPLKTAPNKKARAGATAATATAAKKKKAVDMDEETSDVSSAGEESDADGSSSSSSSGEEDNDSDSSSGAADESSGSEDDE